MGGKVRFGLIGIVIGAIVTWFLTSRSTPNVTVGRPDSNYPDSLDAHFIEQMIPHHEDAIAMAKLAQRKAQRTEVKQLAQKITLTQGEEIDQMKRWYKAWFGREVPTGEEVMAQHRMTGNTGMHMTGRVEDLAHLEKAKDFDVAFVESMIPHHQMAVMMANMLNDGTQRPELNQLADDITSTQTQEISQMRQWLEDWKK